MSIDQAVRDGLRREADAFEPDIEGAIARFSPTRRRAPGHSKAMVAFVVLVAVGVVGTVLARDDDERRVAAVQQTEQGGVPATVSTSPNLSGPAPSTPAQVARGDWRTLLGRVDPAPPPGAIDHGGGLFPERGYSFEHWQMGDEHVLLLEHTGDPALRAARRVVDVVVTPLVGSQWYSVGDCRLDGVADAAVIAVTEPTARWVPASKAWRLNHGTGKAEPIDPARVMCEHGD